MVDADVDAGTDRCADFTDVWLRYPTSLLVGFGHHAANDCHLYGFERSSGQFAQWINNKGLMELVAGRK